MTVSLYRIEKKGFFICTNCDITGTVDDIFSQWGRCRGCILKCVNLTNMNEMIADIQRGRK